MAATNTAMADVEHAVELALKDFVFEINGVAHEQLA